MIVASRVIFSTFAACALAAAQQPPPPPDYVEGNRLDLEGKSKEAKAAFQKAIDSASTPAAKLQALRGMTMSYAFEGDCRNTAKYQQRAIDHLDAQQKEKPGSTFGQQAELANEVGRVCIDLGDLNTAEQWYKKGRDLSLKEANISVARRHLSDFRMEHAMARLAARRGTKALAAKHVAAAQKALDELKAADGQMYQGQQSALPYLTGYVAFYTGDLKTALADLQKASVQDPFIQCLIGMTYVKMGQKEQAMEWYKKASVVTNRTASAAFAKQFTRKKLGGSYCERSQSHCWRRPACPPRCRRSPAIRPTMRRSATST
jgi:tetratricopeptide (TPR) repeat protein